MNKTIKSDIIRGHTDTIILSLLKIEDMYGYQMVKAIIAKSNNQYEPKEATLYSSFKRMEKNKFIRSYWGDESSMGGRRKYYSITDEGRKVYTGLCEEWQFAKGIIDRFVMEV